MTNINPTTRREMADPTPTPTDGISAGLVADAGLDAAADWALRGVIEALTSKRREIVYLATDQIVA